MNGRRTQTSSTPNSHRRCVVASDAAICSPASPHAGLPPPHGRWTFFGTAAGRSDGVLVMEIRLVAPGDHTRPALWDRRESQDRRGQVAPELAGGLRGSLFPRIWSTTDEVGLGFLLLNSCTMGQRILRVERRRGKVGGVRVAVHGWRFVLIGYPMIFWHRHHDRRRGVLATLELSCAHVLQSM